MAAGLLCASVGPAGADAPARKWPTRWKKWERPRYERNSAYPELMSELALPEKDLPKVVEGHPRLLLRAKPWEGGLCVEEIAQRLGKEPGVVAGALDLLVNMGKLDEIERSLCDVCPVRGVCSVISDSTRVYILTVNKP